MLGVLTDVESSMRVPERAWHAFLVTAWAWSGLPLASMEEGRNTTQISCPCVSQLLAVWAAAPLLVESPRPSSAWWCHHPKGPLHPLIQFVGGK